MFQCEEKDNNENKGEPIYVRLKGDRCCREKINKSEQVRAMPGRWGVTRFNRAMSEDLTEKGMVEGKP